MRYVILLLLVLGACSRGDSAVSREQGAKPEPTVTAEASPSQPALTGPSVELVHQGAPPYAKLRTSFEVGSKETLRVKSEWRVAAGVGALVSANFEMPSFTYDVGAEVKEVVGDTTRFEFVIAEIRAEPNAKVSPRYVEIGKKSAALLKGMRGSFSIDGQGLVQTVDITPPVEVTTILHDMIEQVERGIRLASLPLPDGPVGKGAKWTATHALEQRGVHTQQTSSLELLSVEGSLLQGKVTYQTTAPMQTFELPGNPARAKYDLKQIGFEGQAEGTWKLGHLAPRKATETTDIIFKMKSTDAKPQDVIMSRTSTLSVDAKP